MRDIIDTTVGLSYHVPKYGREAMEHQIKMNTILAKMEMVKYKHRGSGATSFLWGMAAGIVLCGLIVVFL